MNLVEWYIISLSENNSPLVTRKLSSALATFLVQFYRLWNHFVRHLIVCLASGQTHQINSIDEISDLHVALELLGPLQVQAALWVIGNVVEDASKLDLNTDKK